MKKALTILLAVAMMFCFSATAFAADFNDTADVSKAAQDAINKVAALGIVEGYEDGSFKPAANITRAEFAKMADIAAGLEDAAKDLEGAASSYKDVKTNVWYTGWINLASAQGYVKGYENGTYGPNNNITYAEVTTVLMRLLGYNDNLTGPWPINYINQATKLDVLDDVEGFSANVPATRANVAIMLAETLDQNIQVWDKDTDEWTDPKSGEKTLLQDSFKGTTVKGIVDVALDDKEDMELTVAVDYVDDKGDAAKESNLKADANTAVAGAEWYNVDGRQATVIFNKDKEVKYIQVEDEIIAVDEAKDLTAATADKTGKIKLDGKSYTVAKGVTVETFTDKATNKNGYAVVNDDDEVTALFTDKNVDGATNENIMKYFGENNLVTEVTTGKNAKLKVAVGSAINADADDAVLVKNGKRIAAEDVKAGDIVVKGAVDGVYGIVANPAIKGDVTRYSSSSVTIGGTSYALDGAVTALDSDYENATADWADLNKKEVSIYVGTNNAVQFVINDNDASAKDYALLLDKTNSRDAFATGADKYKTDSVTVFTKDGETKTLTFEDNDARDDFDKLPIKKGEAFKYALNDDGKIKSTAVVSADANAAKVNDDKNRILLTIDGNERSYNFASNAVIFNIKDDDYTAELLKPADVMASKGDITYDYVETVEDGETNNSARYLVVVLDDNNRIEFMAVTRMNTSTTDADYAVNIDTYSEDGKDYVVLADNDNKEGKAYEVKSGVMADADNTVDKLVKYTLANGKVATIAEVAENADATKGLKVAYVKNADETSADIYVSSADNADYIDNYNFADDCIFVTLDTKDTADVFTDDVFALADKDVIANKIDVKYILNSDKEIAVFVVID